MVTIDEYLGINNNLPTDRYAGGGADQIRSRHLFHVFQQVNKIVRKKERRKRKLIKEARRLQQEADEQVQLLREI
jgi:predicted RNA-binding protein with PIN domain